MILKYSLYVITALQSSPQVEWPGLGLSETWYSLAVSAQSIGISIKYNNVNLLSPSSLEQQNRR